MLSRRAFVSGVIGTIVATSVDASASVARAVSLRELVELSRCFILGTPVSGSCQWEQVGKRRRIVTYSVVQVETTLFGEAPDSSEVLVRSLGGSIGNVGQIVHGEAVLALHERAAVFLSDVVPGVLRVTAMSQGHYPVRADQHGVHRLRSGVSSLELVGENAAVRRLAGRTLSEVQSMIAAELDSVGR